MSLQTRLSSLITAVGADIKADRARLTTLEALTNGPRCLLYKTAAQTITTSTFVPIVWEGEDEDTLGMHATNGTTITVPEAGIYFASAFLGFSVGNVSGRFLTMIYVNGAESRAGFRHEITMAAIGTAAWHTGLPTGLFKLNAGDTLSVVVYQTTGGTLSVSSNSDNAKFGVFKVDVKGATGATGPVGNPPIVVKANRTTTASLTAGVTTRLAWTNEISDDSNIFDGQVFQPTRAGWYRIRPSVWVDNLTGTNSLLSLYLVKNSTGHNYPTTGTLEAQQNRLVYPAQSETTATIELDHLVYMNGTTDFLEAYANFSVSGRVGTVSTWFLAESVGAAGPTGLTGPTGPTGAAGADGASAQPEQIDWQPFVLNAGNFTADPNYVPQWMLGQDGIVHLRGRAKVVAATTGLSFTDASPLYQPSVGSDGTAQTRVPAVNITGEVLGYWEILGTAMIWHGTKATNDLIGLDGVSYPTGAGALGKKVTPTLGSGFTSDPVDPLTVYSNGKQIRVLGAIQGSMAGGGAFTTLFTVAGLAAASHVVVANSRAISVSGANHPTGTYQLDDDDYAFSSGGVLTARSLQSGTNVIKITFNGLFTK